MNLFHLLKNKSGKLTFGVPQMAAVVGAGALLIYGASKSYDAEKAHIAEQMRSITAISAGTDDVRASSIQIANVGGKYLQVANEADRRAMDAKKAGNAKFGAGANDDLTGTLNAGFGGGDQGLGMVANKTEIIENGYNGSGSYGSSGSYGDGAYGESGSSARKGGSRGGKYGSRGSYGSDYGGGYGDGNGFQTASIARASGSGYSGSSYGGTNYGGANGSGNYEFSGKMKDGTDPLSMLKGSQKGKSAGFKSARGSTIGKGKNGKGEGDELRQMAKQSKSIAANADNSANAGAGVFLASSNLSGGMGFDDTANTGGGSSSDFDKSDVAFRNLEGWAQDTGNKEQERNKKAQEIYDLMKKLLALTPAILAAIVGLKHASNAGGPYTKLLIAAAAATAAGLTLAWGHLIGKAAKYWHDYDPGKFNGFSFAMVMMGAVGIAAAWVAFAKGDAIASKVKQIAGKLRFGKGDGVARKLLAGTGKIAGDKVKDMVTTAMDDRISKALDEESKRKLGGGKIDDNGSGGTDNMA